MYTKNIFAAGTLLSAVAAVPMQQNKRDVVWVTETDVVMETVQATTTVWVDATDSVVATQSAPSHYGHGHGHSQQASASSSTPVPYSAPSSPESTYEAPTTSSTYVAPTTSSVYVAPTSSSVYVAPTSSSVYVAPTSSSVYVPPTSSSVYVAPTTTSEYVAPTTSEYVAPTTPTSTYVAPSTTEPSSSYVAPSSASSEAAPSSYSDSSSSTGESYNGWITYYAPGLGSCGFTNSDEESIVAINAGVLDNHSQNAGKCGHNITIEANGVQAQAMVVDLCPACSAGDLDLTSTLFEKFTSLDTGKLQGVKWWFID